jgi:hypothetical protein
VERRPRLIVLAAVIVGLCFAGFCRTAWAQNKAVETQARALQKKAMDEDFLNVDFNKAADKLNQAIAKCGTDKCGANLRALLRRDLATIYSAASKKDEALKAMGDALKIDGSIQLDPNFKTKELDAIYAEARKGGGAGGGGAAGGGGGTPSGDFTHTPPTEQTVRTPLPIYVEYGGSEAVTKVVVKYKAFGMTEFKTFELKKMGMGFGANIPCIDIQEGSIQYYVQGFTANNDPVATSGDRNNPYTVTISKTISGEAPHLPGQEAPAQCPDSGDCPPNFPGCKKGGAGTDNLKGEGADCAEDGECKSGTCKDEKCTAPPAAEATSEDKLPFRRVWIGVSGSLDFQFLSGTGSVCSLNPTTAQLSTTYACTVGGNDFPGNSGANAKALNASIPHGQNQPDAVNSGLSPGNVRILASFDYALNQNFLIGGRAGVVLLAYPGSELSAFPPLHLEARGTLVIGKDALTTKGFHPVLFVGGGVSQFSTSVSLGVNKCVMAGAPVPATSAGVNGGCPAGSTTVAGTAVAWQVGGPGFASPGGGVRWIIADRVAATLNVNFVLAFGGSVGFLFAPSPELGVQVGF